MKPQYRQPPPSYRDRWMVSYVDVLTILLIFFLIASAKSLERPQAAHAVAPAAPPTEKPRTNLVRAQERLHEQGVESNLEPRGLVISLPQVILFSPGEDAVSPHALPTLAQIARVLQEIPNHVRLIGHADTAPIHNRRFGSNWDLSMARSHKILELLSTRYGVPESRISITSYGPYRPVASNDTVDGRALNRRVEMLILDDTSPEDAQAER